MYHEIGLVWAIGEFKHYSDSTEVQYIKIVNIITISLNANRNGECKSAM